MRKEIIGHLKKLSIEVKEDNKRNSIVALRGLVHNAGINFVLMKESTI